MGWIAAAIVYVGFLFKFPKATVITSGIVLTLGILTIGGSIWWNSYNQEQTNKRRDLVSVEAQMFGASCSHPTPLAVTFVNDSDRSLNGMQIEVFQANTPRTFSDKQRLSLPDKISPHSRATWCFSIEKHFDGSPRLSADRDEIFPVKIQRYTIAFK